MDQIDEIKQKTNIANLIGGYVTLKKLGRNYKGLCPFHGEKTPSFMVNEELGMYKCFGCGVGGDAIKFLQEIEGLDFGEALEKLAAKAGVKLLDFKGGDKDGKRELLTVNNLAAEYFHYLLTKHPEGEVARDYLKGREINDKLIETFQLGYALPEWDGLCKYLVKKKGYREDVLIEAGLALRSGSRVYDRFRGRLVFPLWDTAGRVVGFTARVLPQLAREDEPKYVNSPETEIYHKGRQLYGLPIARKAIKKNDRVILVEGQMDMISSYGAGISETVAVGGTALTPEMVEILGRLTSNLIMALDNDFAGEAAMKRSIEAAERRGMSIKMVNIVGGKDPDEIARKDAKAWKEMVEAAIPVYEFFFNKAIGRHGTDSAEGIGKIVKEVIPYLAKIENSVVREVWVRKLAEKIGVDKARVWEELEKERSGVKTQEVKKEKTLIVNNDSLQLIAVLLTTSAEILSRLKKKLIGLPISGAEGKLIEELLNTEEASDPATFITRLPNEIGQLAKEAYLMQPEEPWGEKEVVKLAMSWAKKVVEEEINQLKRQMQEGKGNQMDILGAKVVKLASLKNKLVWD